MSQLITDIVKCKTNDWGIWDPGPNALEWCADGPMSTAASLVAISNKNYVEQNPPVYITEEDTDLGHCNQWAKKPSMPHTYPIEELSNTVPSFSSGETKFRFIIILAGPPGSGKSVMNKNIKKRAKRINFRAFNKLWNAIGHDNIICDDPTFVRELNEISNRIPKNEYSHTDVYQNINNSGEWHDLMIDQNTLYKRAKSWSQTEMTKLQKRDFAKNTALRIYNSLNADLKSKLLKMLVDVGRQKKDKKNKYLELNDFLFNILPNDLLKTASEDFNSEEITTNNEIFNIISQQVNPDATAPIHNLHGFPCFDNDILLYLITTFSILFGMNFTYESTLEIKFKEKSIADILNMTVDEGCDFFENISNIRSKLLTLKKVGLGYIKIGQQATTLSGGEAQRIKLAKELSKRSTGQTLYILDEPTTGLHFEDVKRLLEVLHSLVDKGNTVIVIEHNLEVIKTADHIIDMGPEGGEKGGKIIAEGSPEILLVKFKNSYTSQYLHDVLRIEDKIKRKTLQK